MAGNGTMNCPKPMQAASNGAFQNENPLDYSLPLAILQICLVVVFTRVLALLLKPLRQPRVIAEIVGGIILGPSAAGRSQKFLDTVFPKKSLTVLDTLANFGLLFFLFLVGLELDMRAIRRSGKKAFAIAIAGIGLPFVIGIGTSFALRATIAKGVKAAPFLVFMGVSLSITAFPVLARILAELKLLTTDVGRMAMAAAAVNDVAAWILLALAIALSGSGSPVIAVWVLLCGVGFIAAAFLVLTPVFSFMCRRTLEGEPVKELYICITLVLVLAASFATDTIGIHALFGAFVVGIVVPKDGPFAGVLIEKIEDIVASLLLPLYFVSSGLKTNVATISGGTSWALLVLVVFTACFGKIVGTVLVSMAFKVQFREALAIGFLMNTKGLVELIVLNIGKDRKVLNDETFAILVLMALVTTFITTPSVMAVYHPARKVAPYKYKTVQRDNLETELRLFTCFHSSRNIPTMINLIESSRGTRKGRLCVYAMHLMELSERSSAISMVHKARKNGLPFWNKKPDSEDKLVIAFEAYRQLSSVIVRPMTAISALDTIDDDICTSASQKRAAMIILPFHKHQRLDGVMESLGHSLHQVNQKVLRHAPCSVGILVDRGLGGTTQVTASDVSFNIGVPFFGGRDDCEALSYGARMAEHPGISLTIVRFVTPPDKTMRTVCGLDVGGYKHPVSISDSNISMENHDDLLREARARNKATLFEEKMVASIEDILRALKDMNKYNMLLVGRLPLDLPNKLDKSIDCPELGPLGSFMASTEFSATASVLVVQQYDQFSRPHLGVEEDDTLPEIPDSPI